MDKTQMRTALKAIREDLPKEATVTVKTETDVSPKTFTSKITKIDVAKGYGGTYFANFENGEVITTMLNEQVLSMTIDGVVYDKQHEKKIYNNKPKVDKANAEKLHNQFKTLKVGDRIKLTSTEARLNKIFNVMEVIPVPAWEQTKLLLQSETDTAKTTYVMSRKDSAIINSCEVLPKAMLSVSTPTTTQVSNPSEEESEEEMLEEDLTL
jgi:hypothetical protein